MKPKLWILILLITTLAIYTIRHMTVNYIYQKIFEDSSIYDHGTWVENNLNPYIVFLGSSMTKYTIMPKVINKNSNLKEGKTINLGGDAATPYEMYITFMKNKKKFSKTKIFFFSIEPWIFSKKYYRYKLYEKVLWSKKEWEYYMPEWDGYLGYKNKLYTLSLMKKDNTDLKVKNYGYSKKSHNSEKKFKFSDKKEVLDFFTDKLNNIAISTFQLEYLKKLKDEIEKNGSEFILLYIPNHISYTQSIFKFNKPYNNKLSLLLNDYLGRTKQAGSFCPKNFQLQYEDYFDAYHLANTGAKKFSKKLGNVFELSNKLKEKEIVLNYSCGN